MTAAPSQRPTARLRGLALLLGACILLWLPFEDSHTKWAVGFGAAIAALGAARVMAYYWADRASDLQTRPLALLGRFSLVGILAGLTVPALALFLMVFKTGLHGHGFPDFTFDQIQSVLRRTPVFALSGLLLSLGSGLALLYSSKQNAHRL